MADQDPAWKVLMDIENCWFNGVRSDAVKKMIEYGDYDFAANMREYLVHTNGETVEQANATVLDMLITRDRIRAR